MLMVVLMNQNQHAINTTMKNIIVILLILSPYNQLMCQDNFDYFDGTVNISGMSLYDTDVQNFMGTYGTPEEISYEYWELTDQEVKVLTYNGSNRFFFGDNQNGADMLESFEIKSTQFSINLDQTELKIGFDISTLSNTFPTSYQNREAGHAIIALGDGDYDFILISYDQSEIITKIEHRFF